MSAPTPAPGDDRPREGYYPDPSIPGYVRYWNGASWVPGTSRPAPTGGEPLPPHRPDTPPGTPGSPPAPTPPAQNWPSPAPETQHPGPGYGYPSGGDAGQPPVPGYGYPSGGDAGQPPVPGYGYPSGGGAGQPPVPGYGYPSAPGAGQPPAAGYGYPSGAGAGAGSGAGSGSGSGSGAGSGSGSGSGSGAGAVQPPVPGYGYPPGAATGPQAPGHGHPSAPGTAQPQAPGYGYPAGAAQPPSAGPVRASGASGAPGTPGAGNAPGGAFGSAQGAVPGTAPGAAPTPPAAPPSAPSASASASPSASPSSSASVEATGPHFFDEDPDAVAQQPPGEAQHGSRPEPASAWGADRARQAGFGNDPDRKVSWGSPPGEDPRRPADPAPPAAAGDDVTPDGTFVFRRPATGRPATDEGTMTFRPAASSGPGFGAGKAAAERAAAAQAQPQARTQSPPAPAQASASASAPAAPAVPAQPAAPQPAPAPAATPMAGGPGGGQHSWAQQVHRLAATGDDGEQSVVPWKPPVEDVFQAAARRQSAARPASLGKRLMARLVDTVVLAAVTGAVAVPLVGRAVDHVDEKIDAAKLSGETVTVWFLDGTTAVYLGIVLAVLLLFGIVYEALPTARWGRTLGKRLFGVEVRDIEGHEPPTFGAAVRRWLVYSVPGLLVVGVVGVAWCLFDRPWHQCWHDKAAHTFVAG